MSQTDADRLIRNGCVITRHAEQATGKVAPT
jgi:hypothetical protein